MPSHRGQWWNPEIIELSSPKSLLHKTGHQRLLHGGRYAGDERHSFVRKIYFLATLGLVTPEETLTVEHQPGCALDGIGRVYCDCNPVIRRKSSNDPREVY